MKGLIMDYPLTLTQLFERSRKLFHRKTMATRVPGHGLQCYTYADYAERVARLAAALARLDLQKGDRVGTFAWNSHRHMEVYFATQEQMYAHLRDALAAIHFLYGEKADALMHAVRHLIGRARPTKMECKLLHGLARQIQ